MNRVISVDGYNRNPGITGAVTPQSRGLCRDWIFPGGEQGLEFYTGDKLILEMQDLDEPVWVFLANATGNAVMEAMNIQDALRRMGYTDVRLLAAYMPYGRQDRVTTPGTAFSLEVFAKIINSAGFSKVVTLDPHSMVMTQLIDNLCVIPAAAAMEYFPRNMLQTRAENLVIVAPDKGAIYRAQECAKALGVPEHRLIHATKERDPSNGWLKTTGVTGYKFTPNNYLLFIDDICDGGATFIELAKYLKENGLKTQPSLYVTHGIFSKGIGELSRYFYSIVSTDSFYRPDYRGQDGNAVSGLHDSCKIPLDLIISNAKFA